MVLRRRAQLVVGSVLLLGLLAGPGVAVATPGPRAATDVAAVTVSFGDGRVVHRTVSFAGTISGLDALRQAGFTVDLYGFSGLGGAVCRIDGVGRPADAKCLTGGSEYWSYYRNGVYSRAGATSTQVHDHDQESWAWGVSAAAPPTTAFPPPTTVPPVTQPPATRPPATAPPATRPPATQPVGTQPAGTQAPATAPPPVQPPGSTTIAGAPPSSVAATATTGRASTTAPPSTTASPGPTTDAPSSAPATTGDEQALGPVQPTAVDRDAGSAGARGSMIGFGLVLLAFAALIVRARLRRSG